VVFNHIYERTIKELGDYSSGITTKALHNRYSYGNHGVQLASATADLTEDFLEIVFICDSSYGGQPMPRTVGPKLQSSGKYTIVLRFYKVGDILTSDFKNMDQATKESVLTRVLEECDIRFHSDDPSFQWQGVWENLSKLRLSIYGFRGPKGDGIWQQRHLSTIDGDVYLTKHMVQVLDELDAWVPYIAKKIKQKGRAKANRARLRRDKNDDISVER
jgi:hypothetical protein